MDCLKHYVKRIAHREKEQRRDAILELLRENEIPFSLKRDKENEHWVENIVISLGPTENRLVFGAHYDNVEGSTGANDNASSVVILLRLAKFLMEHKKTNIEIVFFDREEYADHGSSAYIRNVGRENIGCMVNLDMCGYGNTLYTVTKGNVGSPDFYRLLTKEMLKKHKVFQLARLPFRFGDDDTFDSFQIPNIVLSTMDYEEIVFLSGVVDKRFRHEELTLQEQETYKNLTYQKTFHNGPLDSVDSVSEATLQMVYSFLEDGMR